LVANITLERLDDQIKWYSKIVKCYIIYILVRNSEVGRVVSL
jgi:hypothetical protein